MDDLINGSTKISPMAFMCSLKLRFFNLFHITNKSKTKNHYLVYPTGNNQYNIDIFIKWLSSKEQPLELFESSFSCHSN